MLGVPASLGASVHAFRSAPDRTAAIVALGHAVFQALALAVVLILSMFS